MKGIIRKISRGERGFTLVELLVVFTLLGVLAAILIPSVAGLVDHGQTEAAAAELSVVQTGVDSMMAKENLSSVALTTSTANMSQFPTGTPLYPDYVRFEATTGNYSCSTSGLVTQETTGF